LPFSDFAAIAVVGGLGAYVLVADLGFSAILYDRIRRTFVANGKVNDGAMLLALLIIYMGFAVAALLIFVIFTECLGLIRPELRGSAQIFFAAMACGLPWTLVKVTANGIDRFVAFEGIECLRRLAALGLITLTLAGLTFELYAKLMLLLWGLAFLAGGALIWPALRDATSQLGQGFREIRAIIPAANGAMTFSASEAFIYLFPISFVPAAYANPAAITAFDTFHRVVRFCISGYQAAAESTLPRQTRAVHQNDPNTLVHALSVAGVLGSIPMLASVLLVSVWGDWTFDLLLNDESLVPQEVRAAMVLMLIAMLPQAIAGTLLLNTGHSRALAKIAMVLAGLMLLWAATCWRAQIPAPHFTMGYAIIFACGSAVYTGLLARTIGRLRSAHVSDAGC
jgi:hypothetical protein